MSVSLKEGVKMKQLKKQWNKVNGFSCDAGNKIINSIVWMKGNVKISKILFTFSFKVLPELNR